MTKHESQSDENARKMPISDGFFTSNLEVLERSENLSFKITKLPYDLGTFEGSFLKSYLEGGLNILIPLHSVSNIKGGGPVTLGFVRIAYNGETACGHASAEAVSHNDAFDMEIDLCRENDFVFVEDVELMKPDKIIALPSEVGLHIIKDATENIFARAIAGTYVASDGSLHALEIVARDGLGLCGNKRKVTFLGGDMPVCFDQNDIAVIQGGPEIMNSIAKDGGSMPRKAHSDKRLSALAILGHKSFSGITCSRIEKGFKFGNMMIGPFHFQ